MLRSIKNIVKMMELVGFSYDEAVKVEWYIRNHKAEETNNVSVFDILAIVQDEEEYEEVDDYSDMMPCDFSGYCAGPSCSRYYKCH